MADGTCSLWTGHYTNRVTNDAYKALGSIVSTIETYTQPLAAIDPEVALAVNSISHTPLLLLRSAMQVALAELPASDDPAGLGDRTYAEALSEVACAIDSLLITAGHFTSIPIIMTGHTLHAITTLISNTLNEAAGT